MKHYHDCMEVREEFSAYLDGELAVEEREGFEAHLTGCAECLRELDTMKRVDVAYRGLPAVSAPAGFEADVREAVRTGRVGSEVVRRPVPRWMGPLVALGTAAAMLIVSVIVFETREGAQQEMQVASAPMRIESGDVATLMQTAPGTPPAASAPDQGPAGGGEAWGSFMRAAEPAPAPEPAQDAAKGKVAADGAWENFARAPEETKAGLALGREDNSTSLSDAAGEADAETRSRAELIGTPPAAAAAAPEASAEGMRDEQPKEEVAQTDPFNVRAEVGEVVSRRMLRSFKVRADGTWVESGYAGEPTTELKRGSDELNAVMKKHSSESWDKILDRTAVQIFELDDVWYALDGKPEEQEQ